MPQFCQSTNPSTSRTIYINPLFNKRVEANAAKPKTMSVGAHINPLFLGVYRPPAIHMNPNFFNTRLIEQQKLQSKFPSTTENVTLAYTHAASTKQNLNQPKNSRFHGEIIDLCDEPDPLIKKPNVDSKSPVAILENKVAKQKLISKSRTKIVREPAIINKITQCVPPAPIVKQPAPIIRLTRRKLIRKTQESPVGNISRTITPVPAPASSINTQGKYKLDRRPKSSIAAVNKSVIPGVKLKRKSFVARYALRRTTSESRIGLTSSKLRSLPINKKLQMLNINGVLYRSTRNKLQRKDTNVTVNLLKSNRIQGLSTKPASIKNSAQNIGKISNDRVLFVHGTKFILDKNGFKLTRIAPTNKPAIGSKKSAGVAQRLRRRIDIGGLTYVASPTQNVFVRTSNHLTLAHLNTAKNRSLQLLTRRLVKSNIPCAIYQRIGKCIAHERGKCNKVHDKKHVTICPRFLRSECHNPDCLLSHNVSLAKMPVCKFFLQGVCVRTDCPYLHKKLSITADVCQDFLRGYCKLAEQCNKRHEFVCPEYERNGKCELVSCIYCKNRKRKQTNEQPKHKKKSTELSVIPESSVQGTQESNSAILQRYFVDNCSIEKPVCDEKTSIDESGKIEHSDVQSVELDSDSDTPSVAVRPKVGALPAFIPLL
uniref:Zinc finger CCCH domain-containing protein 7 n=1 Tax=Ceratitis capitata TaxID=7213 RepID=W8BV14_CERCA